MKKLLVVLIVTTISLLIGKQAFAGLDDGLVAYWSFDDCAATDDSGNSNDGYIYGTPVCVGGIFDNSLQFGGVHHRDYVLVPNSPELAFKVRI